MKRLTIIALALLAFAPLAGCDFFDGKTKSPFTGQLATADQIDAQAKAEIATKTTEAKQKAEAEVVAAMTRKAEFDEAVAQLDADTRIKLTKLQALYEVENRQSQSRIARIEADGQRAVTLIADLTKGALDALDQEAKNASMVFNIAGQGASMIPVYGTAAAGLVATLGGVVLGNYRGRSKGEEKGWKEAKEESAAHIKDRDENYEAGQKEALLAAALSALLPKPPTT